MGLNSRKKSMAARVCALAKSPRNLQIGLHISKTSDQRPLHGVAKTWSRCRFRALMCSNAGNIHIKVDQWLLRRSCRGKNLSCSRTHSTGRTYKSRGIVVGSVQTVAAIASDESLQVRVRKAHSPGREVISAPFGTQRCQNGCPLTS